MAAGGAISLFVLVLRIAYIGRHPFSIRSECITYDMQQWPDRLFRDYLKLRWLNSLYRIGARTTVQRKLIRHERLLFMGTPNSWARIVLQSAPTTGDINTTVRIGIYLRKAPKLLVHFSVSRSLADNAMNNSHSLNR